MAASGIPGVEMVDAEVTATGVKWVGSKEVSTACGGKYRTILQGRVVWHFVFNTFQSVTTSGVLRGWCPASVGRGLIVCWTSHV